MVPVAATAEVMSFTSTVSFVRPIDASSAALELHAARLAPAARIVAPRTAPRFRFRVMVLIYLRSVRST